MISNKCSKQLCRNENKEICKEKYESKCNYTRMNTQNANERNKNDLPTYLGPKAHSDQKPKDVRCSHITSSTTYSKFHQGISIYAQSCSTTKISQA
jgi:hypothetical protein